MDKVLILHDADLLPSYYRHFESLAPFEVVRQNNLKAKPEQVRAVVEEHADSFEDPKQIVRWYYSDQSRLAEVEAMVLEDNVVEWASKSMEVLTVEQSFDAVMEITR